MAWTQKDKYLAAISAALPVAATFLPTATAACNGQCPACGGCLTLVMGTVIAGTAGLIQRKKANKTDSTTTHLPPNSLIKGTVST